MSRLRALRHPRWILSPRRVALLLRVLAYATRASFLLSRMALPAFMDRWTPRLGQRPGNPDELVEATDLALLYAGKRRCLTRSLVLYRLLRQAGQPVEFVMGVRRDPAGGIMAHAWLEQDGRATHPYGDDPQYYTVTYRYP